MTREGEMHRAPMADYRMALLIAAAGYCAPAWAQANADRPASPALAGADEDAGRATGRPGASGDEIVVTASRREQRLQDTALTVNAVSADRLDAANVTDTAGLQTTVPSLNIATSAGSSFVYVRGVGSNVSDRSRITVSQPTWTGSTSRATLTRSRNCSTSTAWKCCAVRKRRSTGGTRPVASSSSPPRRLP